ncbi:ABC transporter substrate-binding protein, partial [Streptomyces sp. NPDC002039]
MPAAFTTSSTSRRQFLTLLGISAAAVSCGTATATGGSGKQVTSLKYQGSVGAVTLPELAADLGYLGNLTLDWVGNTISGPQDI